eukprot:TRINITY_DN1519_c0_g1_i6.p1 TRINITY_DN1519_c0_g1~~TRINITY_DN1519_c0_g1_i6.p1  ORF type:complete len:384 (+),score=45.28 TRINITY_DN1519_c0_g1_i6:173-1324(+)
MGQRSGRSKRDPMTKGFVAGQIKSLTRTSEKNKPKEWFKMRIQNNTTAFSVWASYSSNLSKMQTSMSRLSTGSIANTDDPAGVGISGRMKAQINAVRMARQNTNNAVSLLQTADSWLENIGTQLSRMKELSIEAASGVVADSDIANIQAEFQAMQEEIVRVTSKYSAGATYNGIYLFRGGDGKAGAGDVIDTNKSIEVQVGADQGQLIDMSLVDLQDTNTTVIGTVSTYGYDDDGAIIAGSTVNTNVTWASIIRTSDFSVTSANVTGALDIAIDFISNARASMAAQQNRLDATSAGLLTYQDNLTTAESQIADVDMALETTKYSTYEVLTNAANAMLAQANQLGENILQLLQQKLKFTGCAQALPVKRNKKQKENEAKKMKGT